MNYISPEDFVKEAGPRSRKFGPVELHELSPLHLHPAPNLSEVVASSSSSSVASYFTSRCFLLVFEEDSDYKVHIEFSLHHLGKTQFDIAKEKFDFAKIQKRLGEVQANFIDTSKMRKRNYAVAFPAYGMCSKNLMFKWRKVKLYDLNGSNPSSTLVERKYILAVGPCAHYQLRIRFDVRPKGIRGQETMTTTYSLAKPDDNIKIQLRYFTPKEEEYEVQRVGFQDKDVQNVKIKCDELLHEEPENQEVQAEAVQLEEARHEELENKVVEYKEPQDQEVGYLELEYQEEELPDWEFELVEWSKTLTEGAPDEKVGYESILDFSDHLFYY